MSIDLTVGARIRALRHDRGLSLETVATRSGLSIGFVSQVERGLSSPSLKVLTALGDVLGVGLAGLFGPAPAEGTVVMRRAERPGLNLWRSGITKQLLSPAGDGGLSLFLVTMEPGASTGDEFYTHAGEEAGTVLEGGMALTVDAESWTLQAGDGFRFASRRPHRFANPSAESQAVVLWINCVIGR